MEFKFDPTWPPDRDAALRVIGLFSGEQKQSVACDPADAPTPEQPEPTNNGAETDIHGMVWDEAIHASTKTKNADGSWKARKGCKDELEAAIAAHKAEQTAATGAAMVTGMASGPAPIAAADPLPTPAPTGGMPAPQPAASAPTAPQPSVSYDEMATRFVGMINAGKIVDFEAVYRELEIDYSDLETNQTSISRLWQYMTALDAGAEHTDAVQRAMAAA